MKEYLTCKCIGDKDDPTCELSHCGADPEEGHDWRLLFNPGQATEKLEEAKGWVYGEAQCTKCNKYIEKIGATRPLIL